MAEGQNPFANKTHHPAEGDQVGKHFTLCEKSTGPVGQPVTCPICLRLRPENTDKEETS